MKRHADKLMLLLALLVLLAYLVSEPGRVGGAPVKPMNHAATIAPLSVDRSTKFDLLFAEPDLARP